MFSKNNLKMNSTKQSEKINQYGIKKFNAGTASVLIASGFLFLGGAAQAADTNKQETPVETTAKDKSTEKVETPKAEVAEKTAEKSVESTVVKTSAVKTKLQEKINRLNDLFVTLAGKDLSETQQKLTVDAAIELNKAKDLIVDENATQAQVDAQTVALENSISFLNKSLEAKKVEDKKVEDKKAEDKKEAKSEEKSDKKEAKSAKEELEKTISEAKVINQAATAFAEKSVKEESKKAEIKAAVATAEKQIAKALDVFNSDSSTKSDSERERKELERAIEAVYATMQRAGHRGKLEGLLADAASTTVNINNPINKVVVNNVGDITDEEARAIEKEIRTANPTLTAEDKIEVKRQGNLGQPVATITLANGRVDQDGSATHSFAISDVSYGSAGEKNYSQLREAINWFDFATASITYNDGTKVGPVEYVNNPTMVNFTSSKGRQERGRFTMVRTVLESTTHPELVGKKTNDPAFLASGLAKYTLWKTYDHVKHEVQQGLSEGRGNNEIFEVLQEGMRFDVPTKVKGYTLSATVSSLSRKKVTTETYTLNKANGEPENINRSPVDGVVQREDVIVTRQDPNWSHLRLAGFETKYEDSNGVTRERLTAFAPAYDGGNVGVKFQLSATYNGRPVAVNAIAVDSEDLSVAEFTQFESDGTPWEEFMRLNKNKTDSKGLLPNREGNGNFLNTFDRKTDAKLSTGYKLSEWTNKTETGYGSQLFGPFDSGINTGHDLPIGLTQNVENLGVYINANGSQSATVGFVIYDGGDAPGSYGSAQHIIGNFNKDKNGTQVTATQPYLGDVPADSDFRTTIAEPNGAWVLDDLVNSEDYKEISLVSGTTQVTNSKGQSGTYLLDGKNPVIRMADGTQVAIKNGEILSTANTLQGGDNLPIKGLYNQATRGLGVGNLPDEGEGQLLDPAVATKYTLRHASENEYILKGIKVNRGVNNDVAYVRGWVDFNGNGKFDLYESSELVTANADGTYDITFKNTPQLLNTSVDNLGVRLRVSVDKNDLRLPTGLASSGEVEDFVANVIHQPRGTRHKTQGFQGAKQEVNFPTNAMFTASGKTIESNYKQWAQIDNNTAPKMVLNDTVVKSEEPTGKTVEVKDHLSQTIYNGTEVVVKDARGNTLGTAVKVLNKLTGKTEYYLSKYTEYDTAGNKVGVYELNEGSPENKNTAEGSLNFTKITFQPEPGFVGTAKGVAVRAWDDNGSHTGWEATEDTIRESLTSTTLAEKDKVLENVNNGNNGAKSMDTSYIPTVIDVRPVGEDTTTEDVQGAVQKSNPTIPAYGTVETVTNDKVEDVKYTAEHVILDKTKKPTFATRKETPGKLYTEDTKVDKDTTLTLTDGSTVTYKPVDKIPAGTKLGNKTAPVTVTGTGNVTATNVRFSSGSVPAGSVLEGALPTATEPTTVLRNGANVVVPAGSKLQVGDQLVTPLKITGGAQITTWKATFAPGETIPAGGEDRFVASLVNETTADQLVPKGESITLNGKTYNANNDVIPKGTRTASTYEDLMNVTLPNAVHIDPQTGEVTSVPRRYTKVTDTEIVIENEGTYTLNQDTGEITFTPDPKFVGTGTGVVKQQPDVDYNDKVAGDPVTSKYGTDYGKAKYTPVVKPQSKASITRTIHYVYENANDNPTSQDSYKDNDPIVAIDNTPVTRTQTIDYTREYKIFSEAGTTDTEITTANQVTDATGHVYNVGDTIPAGTKFNQGSIIIGKWTASSDANSKFKEIISPTVKGYTAEVVTADFTPREDGKMGHIHNGKQPVGLYTPVADNTRDVGAYEPLVSEVRADDKDDFDMYVVYKADIQKAKVTYIDLDATGDARILEVQNANPAPATGADAKTTFGVTTLQGKSHTAIPYTTAETIKKYEDLGYELVTDDFTNNTQGNPVEGGRKFDDDKEVDQAFNVYLRHKKVEVSDSETQEVTRTINYKYANTTDVPADKRGTTAAPSVVETLTYKRDRTIDLVLAAKAYPTEYATYKAEAAKGTDAEKAARTVLLDHVASKAAEATATDAQKAIITYGQWAPKAGKATGIELSTEEKTRDNKFNNVPSPTVAGYTPDKVAVDATTEIDAEAVDYTVEVLYTPEKQRATVKFVEVDPTNTDKVITPGLADPIAITGKSEAAYPATTATSVTDKIAELVKKGYELVDNGFVSTDKFDKDAAVDQEYVVKFKAKVVDIPSFDPTKPASNDNPKPTPGEPIDPNNPTGPKWTPELIKELEDGRKEEVKRTINYVYVDGKKAADSVEETKEFKRSATINPVTGKITFGDWSPANQTFGEVTSPEIKNYTPNKATVSASEVTATAEDINETVVYTTKPVTLDPSKPTDPNTPNVTPKPDDRVPNDPKGRTYKELGLIEEVTHTVHYKLADGSDAGIPDNVQTLTFTRTADLDPVTGAISNFSDWKAKGDDTTIDAITTPNKPGYVASAATSTARENVKATDKDSEETIIYRKLGSYVPVIPEGVTPPPGTDLTPKPYETPTNEDPTRPGTPTETPVVPYIPGTTPVGPNGKPLTPKDPNDPTKGYEVPKVPEDPTQNTTITYVKDGSQVALVHFIKADGTAVHVSVAEAGDTGKAIKTTNIDNVKAELEAKGYEVVAPTDAAYTAERVAFYADANRTFDDKDDKGDKGISQVYYVIVKEGISPIDPDKPLDPNNPNVTPKPEDKVPGDPKQRTFEQLGLLDEVNRTINYRYANTDKVEEAKRGQEAAATVEQKLRYSRKGDLNKVTGEITYTSDWTKPQTLAEVTSPVIEGYVADIKAAEKVENVAHDAADSVVNVVYSPLGKYVPKVPEGFEVPKVEKPQYPNDPTDPTKPGTPTTVIPHVPGTTPKDPNGNPLKPVDPNDPTKGYVPPTPENPTEDTQITYEKDTQKAKVTYVVEGTGTVLHTDNLEGKSGEPIEYSTVAKLAELKALGYDLVSDGFTTATDKNYDKDTKVDQSFVVTVKPHLEPLKPVDPENPNDPNKPKPGQPIDPNNPDGPKWTEDLIKKIDTTRHVNRTITYVDEKGNRVTYTDKAGKDSTESIKDKVTFTREGKINSVTGEITYGDWTAKDGDTKFDAVTSPVVKGYILKDAKQKEVAATENLTADSKDENIEVVYTKLGSWVPKVPEGETPIDPIPYPNDPKDPTKPGNDRPIVPYVPGTTPKVPQDPTKPVDPKTNPLVPLTPVDPNDPTKGYEVPPVPTEPGKDIEIKYEKDEQRATVKYVVEGTGTVLHTDNLKGKSGEPIEYSTVAKLAELKALGYDLVSDGFTTATDKNFDKDSSKDQEYTVVLTQHSEPLKPVDPENPNDPNRPKPGQPIDPNNPNGPKWTEDLIKQIDTTRHVNRTIKYVNEKGEEVAKKVTDKVTFTREGKINAVTGVITYGDWTAKGGDTTFDKVESPVVKGYILKDAKQKEIAATTGLTADSKDENIEVVYTKLGSWVPKVPEGVTPIDPTPYPNDPKDPTKPGNDRPIVPYVPGTTPVVPKDPTKPISPDNPLVPLTPVDPKDPTKGYEVPPVPTDPNTDTPINYVTDKQKAITNFVTESGKVVSTPVVDEGDSGANFTKSKVDEVTKTIEKLEKAGYRVVKNDFPSKDTDRVFDKDKSVDQIFNVTVAERIIPVTPGKPVDPNDPNLPKNPDGTPVTPSTPEPGKPVFPNDPNSPVWPSTVKDLVTEKSATRTIKYVDRNGKEVTETRVETIKFTRDAKINLVTGEITYGEWTTDRNDDIFNGYPVPVVKGYIAKEGDLESSTKDVKVTPDTIKDINETVVYDKLGSWVPNIPGTPTNPIPYPNDPKDPTKPGSDKPIVPYVPGHTPMVPQDPTKPVGPNNPLVPLKPVDPNDPTKGYEVPNVPNDPTKDTPISYVPVPQPTPKPTPTTPVTPETPKAPEAPVTPKAPTQVKRLANTGTTETNTGLAGLGMAIFGGLLAAARRRKNNED